ncbi:MAG: NYN domain-containing protein [Planctomycetales bacterium]|nr:NYN domain-containing protein [Planctomycetales bacterium]
MALLIDGYNLLHAAGIFGKGRGGASLQRSREAMLRFLAASVDDAERPRTTVVFDAADAPPGLPQSVTFAEMLVRYAATYADADELLEELIAAHHAPRTLLVVSSDHRIQRAARRRRCRFIDSDQWYAAAVRRRQHNRPPAVDARKRLGEATEDEVAYWVEQFTEQAPTEPSEPPPKKTTRPREPGADSLIDPFPPGYADDLFDDASES